MKLWTEDEVAHLVARRKDGASYSVIAHELGRNADGVAHKAHRLGLPPLDGYQRQKKSWTPDEVATMKRMLRKGASYEAVAKTLHRSVGGVKRAAVRQGVNPASQGVCTGITYRADVATTTAGRLEQLRELPYRALSGIQVRILIDAGDPVEELAARWGVTPEVVRFCAGLG